MKALVIVYITLSVVRVLYSILHNGEIIEPKKRQWHMTLIVELIMLLSYYLIYKYI